MREGYRQSDSRRSVETRRHPAAVIGIAVDGGDDVFQGHLTVVEAHSEAGAVSHEEDQIVGVTFLSRLGQPEIGRRERIRGRHREALDRLVDRGEDELVALGGGLDLTSGLTVRNPELVAGHLLDRELRDRVVDGGDHQRVAPDGHIKQGAVIVVKRGTDGVEHVRGQVVHGQRQVEPAVVVRGVVGRDRDGHHRLGRISAEGQLEGGVRQDHRCGRARRDRAQGGVDVGDEVEHVAVGLRLDFVEQVGHRGPAVDADLEADLAVEPPDRGAQRAVGDQGRGGLGLSRVEAQFRHRRVVSVIHRDLERRDRVVHGSENQLALSVGINADRLAVEGVADRVLHDLDQTLE